MAGRRRGLGGQPALAAAAAVELCREWAEGLQSTLPAGADEAASLSQILGLLERLAREPENDGFATVASLLSVTLQRRGQDRMLRPDDEEEIRARARETVAEPIEELLDVELLRRGVKRQSELEHQAEAFLQAGAYSGTVKRSARRNAERLYLAY